MIPSQACQKEFEDLQVEYITVKGWKTDISKVRSFQELPIEAQAYVRKIEELLNIPGYSLLHPRTKNSQVLPSTHKYSQVLPSTPK